MRLASHLQLFLPEILMRKMTYAMHFRGRTSLAAADSNSLRATGSAASCVVSTTIRHSGMESELKPSEGDLAFLDSNLRLTGPHSFQEEGTITFGGDSEHILRFSTMGEGHFSAGLEPGTMAGSASWNVEGGEGQFA